MIEEIRGIGKRPGEFPSGQLLFDAFMGHCCAFAPNFKPTCGMLLQALKSLLRETFEAFFGAISTRAQELLRFPAYKNEGAKEHEEEATLDLKASFQPFAACEMKGASGEEASYPHCEHLCKHKQSVVLVGGRRTRVYWAGLCVITNWAAI